MLRPSLLTLLLAVLALAASGCAHDQLRWNTVQQSRSLSDIYEQQVLNNLAMFARDPGAMPFFAYPNAGATDVSGEGSVGSGFNWSDTSFLGMDLAIGGRRGMSEAWTLMPVSDPRRLQLMRCAYQQAVANAGIGEGESYSCPDCNKALKQFYLGDAGDSKTIGAYTTDTGNVTTACLSPGQWFGVGPKECVPKKCPCLKVGHYCGTYVWVLPGGQQELSKLTLVILDFAINVPPPLETKEVVVYFDNARQPTTKDKAVIEVRSTLLFSSPVNECELVNGVCEVGAVNKGAEPSALHSLPAPSAAPSQSQGFAPMNTPSMMPLLEFNQNQRFLSPRRP